MIELKLLRRFEDDMELAEALIKHVIKTVLENARRWSFQQFLDKGC